MLKKLLWVVLILLIVLVIATSLLQRHVYEEVHSSDLPQDVFDSGGDTTSWMQGVLLDFLMPTSSEDDRYTLVEEYINLLILQSVHDHVNAEYAPLDDTCLTPECDRIADTGSIVLTHAYATLNNDDQLVLTIGLERAPWPAITTAIHLTFDVEWSLLEQELTLSLVAVHLHETELSIDRLDQLLSLFDKDAIEDSISRGTLDLTDYTYTTSLLWN